LIISIIAVIYSLVAFKYWVSISTILPADRSNSDFNLGPSALLGLGSNFFGGGNYLEGLHYKNIMMSRSFSENIIKNLI